MERALWNLKMNSASITESTGMSRRASLSWRVSTKTTSRLRRAKRRAVVRSGVEQREATSSGLVCTIMQFVALVRPYLSLSSFGTEEKWTIRSPPSATFAVCSKRIETRASGIELPCTSVGTRLKRVCSMGTCHAKRAKREKVMLAYCAGYCFASL